MNYLRFVILILFLSGVIVSCQKDQGADIKPVKLSLKSDSINNSINGINSPGNFLAAKGTLKVTIEDSTYIFDALKDSIAFVNVSLDSNKYFGITAINKAHTVSFGISAIGTAGPDVNSAIAGSQLLFNNEDKPGLQYALSKYINADDIGKINLIQYQQDSVLARGTFYTLLSKDGKSGSPFLKTIGSFNLQLK